MTRKEQLQQIIYDADPDNEIKTEKLIDEIIFIEENLTKLKELPFIVSNVKKPSIQKITPAAKQYKELLQQYNNCLRLLFKVLDKNNKTDDDDNDESPLRKWLRERSL